MAAVLHMRMRAIELLQDSGSTRLQTRLAVLTFRARTGALCIKSSMLDEAKICLESSMEAVVDFQTTIAAGHALAWTDKEWNIVREGFMDALRG